MLQQELFIRIEKRLNRKTSLIDAVAESLDISYDAAHRRTSLKSKLSLEESIKLAKDYNISLDQLFSIGKKNIIVTEKNSVVKLETDLTFYFIESYKSLKQIVADKSVDLTYLAKDIPIFHTLNNTLLNRFKIYAWFKILNPELINTNFNDFRVNTKLMSASKQLGNLYKDFHINEIWDTTTINSTLKQIHYYYKSNLIDLTTSLELCKSVNDIIASIMKKVLTNSNHKLYYNELLLMNNQVIINSEFNCTLFVPFKALSYLKITDINTCNETKLYIEKLKQQSKLLNQSGEKDITLFFTKIFNKIDALKKLINAENELDFE